MSDRTVTLFTESNFSDVEHFAGVSIIRFQAPWCAPCSSSEGFFDLAISQMPETIITGKVNVIQAPVLASKYGVWGLPNTLIFRNGQVVDRISGPQPAAVFLKAVQKAMENIASD
ncbi:thioredoxin [Citrobacter sp. Awk 2]|uniref:thioredoxin family protein n=1 Tax=unclassified Citrobacter TaxID=2644389 RepID=UPI001077DCF4|nr:MULTISPECIES: thioredoxin domain-containing protein [unclassified Citrobacter]MDA8503395.1 thioredoxin [Citrobacter sp. Awk 2]MDA8513621.1 thioredoxin [Citrobacter sp. Igbk 14]